MIIVLIVCFFILDVSTAELKSPISKAPVDVLAGMITFEQWYYFYGMKLLYIWTQCLYYIIAHFTMIYALLIKFANSDMAIDDRLFLSLPPFPPSMILLSFMFLNLTISMLAPKEIIFQIFAYVYGSSLLKKDY